MNSSSSAVRAALRERPFGRVAHPTLIAAVFTGVLLVSLTVLAMTSTIGAIVSVAVALVLIGLLSLGLDRTAEAFVLLGALLVPMNDLHTSGVASFVTAADAAFVLGFGLMMPGLISKPLRLPATFVVGGVGVVMVALISSLLTESPVNSLNFAARLVVGALGLSVLFAWWAPDLKKVVTIAWAYVLGNVISAGYSMIDGTVSTEGRRVGLTEHPNIFGLCALLGLALVPFLYAQTSSGRRWLPVVAGLVCFWGIWTSGSRGALAAMLAVALIYPLLSRSVFAALGLLAAFAVAMVFSEQLLSESSSANALGRLLGQGSASGSDSAREQLAIDAFDQFLSHPILGVGLADVIAAHIVYLQIVAGLGVLGLTAYALVAWATIRPAITLTPPLSLLALPALSYAVLGWVTPVLWDRYIWVALALSLLAPQLAASAADTDNAGEATGEQPPGRHLNGATVVRNRLPHLGT